MRQPTKLHGTENERIRKLTPRLRHLIPQPRQLHLLVQAGAAASQPCEPQPGG